VGLGPVRVLDPARWRSNASLVAVVAVALAAGYATWHSTFGRELEYSSIDARFSVRGRVAPSPRVVVVGIDEPTIEGGMGWPVERRYDAQMIDKLRRDGARVIAYDLVFDHAGPDPSQDVELFDAAQRAGAKLVLGGGATNRAGQTFVLGGSAHQRDAGVHVGSIYFEPDLDGVIRRAPYRIQGLRSFAAQSAIAEGRSPAAVRALYGSGGSIWIDFPGPAGTVRHYSFIRVLDGRVPASAFRGKIVVVGAYESILQDVHTVAFDGAQQMSGPELEADTIATLLEGAPLRAASSLLSWLILCVAALALPLLACARRPWPWITASGLLAAAAYVFISQVAFDAGTIVLLVPVLATLVVAGAGAVLVPLALERRELRVLRDRFARFDPVVVNAVLADPGVAVRLRALAIGPESVIAGYRIVALAGRGGMGVVYEAVQLSLDRPVALKLIDPARADDGQLRARFIRESRIAASLAHPHVIPVYEAGEDNGLLFITMRLVGGGSLHDLIAARAPIAPVLAASIAAQVASALDAAHAGGLVHRDVKPANILLERRSEGEAQHCYLSDFGVTRETRSQGLTVIGERIGTVDYMAPELCRGEPGGPAADTYSLGCVLFEMLTGSVPFPRASEAERIDAHISEPAPVPSERWPGVPVAFDAVVARALAKDPALRFASGLELERAVLASAGIEPVGVVARASVAVTGIVGERTLPSR
jgi:CHASE2 domain-containing sensor protein